MHIQLCVYWTIVFQCAIDLCLKAFLIKYNYIYNKLVSANDNILALGGFVKLSCLQVQLNGVCLYRFYEGLDKLGNDLFIVNTKVVQGSTTVSGVGYEITGLSHSHPGNDWLQSWP